MPDLNSPSNRAQVGIIFPSIPSDELTITSPIDNEYNCIAWAAGDTDVVWDPTMVTAGGSLIGGYYWPSGLPLVNELGTFVRAFRRQGFRECDSGEFEAGLEKVAIYTDADGVFTHVSRQLEDGIWTSKLGMLFDISHVQADTFSGTSYGDVAQYMSRPRKSYPHPRARNIGI